MKTWLPLFLLFLTLSAVFVFGPGQLLEPDQFYHMKHAAIYAESGLFQTAFPWTQFSVWKTYQADIWYGFHLLLIPLTVFADMTVAIKIAATLLTSLALLAFWFVLKRQEIRWPVFWTLLFYFATPNLLFRLNQLRPNTLTLVCLALLFSFLIKPAAKRRWLVIGGISFAITFFHLSFFWVAPFMAAVITLVKLFLEKEFAWRAPLCIALGTLIGWLARPNPIGALKILKVQLIDLIAAKSAGVPLMSGDEIRALDWAAISQQLIPLLLIAIVAMIIFIRSRQDSRSVFAWSALGFSAIFFALGFTLGRRATDFFALFAVFFAAYVFSSWRSPRLPYAVIGLASVFLVMLVWHSYVFTKYAGEPPGGTDQLKAVSLWLKDHSRPGDIIFHTSWDSFPMLFFWNSNNYYINGADSIFAYAYDKKLYIENLYLAVGGKPYTCESLPCTAQNGKDLYAAIAGDFRAAYIMVELSRNSGLAGNLDKDRRFEKAFSTEEQVVYKVR